MGVLPEYNHHIIVHFLIQLYRRLKAMYRAATEKKNIIYMHAL